MEFKVTYTDYTEEGAPTQAKHCEYFSTADAAEQKYNELNRIRYPNGQKTYKMGLEILTYKEVTDVAAFFTQFHT